MKTDIEKSLKRFLKRKVSYSFALLIAFLISGEIISAAEINTVESAEKVEMRARDAKDLVTLFKILKNKTVVQKSEDKSTQFFFNAWLEKRKAKKYADNGFKEWGENNITPENPENPDIEIPDIVTPIKPSIEDPESAIPSENFIEEEPSFEFNPVGNIAMGDIPQDITINVTAPKVPVSEIGEGDFNIFDKNSISNPGDIGNNVGGIDNVQLSTETNVQVQKPTVEYSGNITTFTPPEIPAIQVGTINAPASFSIDAVNITTGTVNQDTTKEYAKTASDYVVKNYTSYKADERGFNIWFSKTSIWYDNKDSRGDKKLTLDGNTILQKDEGNNHYIGDYVDTVEGTNIRPTNYISDVIGKDVSVEGPFTLTYQGRRSGESDMKPYVRIFLTSSSKGLQENSSENTKITEFIGDLNLATTNEPDNDGKFEDLKGNLIGMEHQIWGTKNNTKSVLINSGNINIGNRLDPSGGSESERNTKVVNKNMIGIMVDYAGSVSQEENTSKNMTINAGEISIEKPENFGVSETNILNPSNNIGISFEENPNGSQNGGAVLNDDVYIGKINIGDNTEKNYGFRMGNIYSNSAAYFDKTKVIGNLDSGTTITFENDIGVKQITNYTSKIDVKGTNNIGMVVGKSLSTNANTNPIDNFENISIGVNGTNNIGFVRDKNYSDNNKNDMVINDKNITDISFGENATNSVLIRSEQYGINLAKNLDVSSGKAVNDQYNVALQATRQTWNNGTNDINSAGSVENSENLSGETNRMVGVMSSGTLTNENAVWQNGDKNNEGKALAKNSGEISLRGNNNIGMAVLNGNSGNNTGTISITGNNGVGIYNEDGTITASGTINITGNNSVGIYSKGQNGKLNLAGLKVVLKDSGTKADTGTTGIYVSNGTVNFGSTADTKTTITGAANSQAGLYGTGNVNVTGHADISGTKVGIVSAKEGNTAGNITVKGGHISYSGDSYALYTDSESKITLDNNSSLTLAGNAYGMNIDTSRTDANKAIDFGGATINIGSNNVTIFNVVDKEGDYALESGDGNLPGADSLSQYVGTISKIESNGNEGYKIASVDGGIITLNSSKEKGNNEGFLKKYKFQKSKVNMTTDTTLALTNNEANTYFNGEVIGIGQSSSQNINQAEADGTKQRAETTITINNGATVTADRTEEATDKSTIGAYIDYGVISLTNGKIVVEDDGTDTANKVNDNGIGIYAKNGSKVATDRDSSITVYGNNGVGIYAEATEEIKDSKNKFGGNITTLEISNAGNITLDGESGIGIYADNENGTEKATVSNTGTIKVGKAGSTKDNSSVGILGKNTIIENKGSVEIGCNHNSQISGTHGSVGIYAENSDVKVFDKDQGSIALGDYSTGIYLDGNSNISTDSQNGELVFKNLKTTDGSNNEVINSTSRTGIYFADNGKDTADTIDFNIDMSEVDNGRAIVSDGRNITLNRGKTITVSGNGGKGIRVAEAEVVNNGEIIIKETAVQNNEKAIGLLAADKNGILNNSGTITVKGTEGIGIYAENDPDNNKTGNSIENIGIINLGADGTIGVVAKKIDTVIDNNDSISFTGATNSIGIYAEGGKVTNNKSEFTVTGSGKDKLENKNIGIYLGSGASYEETANGSIKVENGAVGIYADKGVSSLENINILSDSQGVQTIGVALNGENKEEKTISGNIKLTNSTTDISKVKGNNTGIYAKNSTVNINKTLTLDYAESNGTGIYLDDSVLSGSGTVNITGTGKEAEINGENKIPNSIGIYYSKSNTSGQDSIVSNNSIKVNIDKSNTIGVYVADGASLTKGQGGAMTIGEKTSVENVTGFVAGENSSMTNNSTIM